MCLIWQVKVRNELLNLGICNSGKINLPKKTSAAWAKKQIKNPKKRLIHLFGLYTKEYRIYEPLLGGLLDMIEALDYHYKNHSKFENIIIDYYKPLFEITFSDPEHKDPQHNDKCEKVLNSKANINLDNYYKKASYEASAYLNRLGQIKTLLDSKWFSLHGLNAIEIKDKAPTLEQLIHLRNKVTSHRREDDPRKEDIGQLSSGLNHFRFRASLGGDLKKKTISLRYQLISKVARKGYVDFAIREDHFLVVEEILHLVEQFFNGLRNSTF